MLFLPCFSKAESPTDGRRSGAGRPSQIPVYSALRRLVGSKLLKLAEVWKFLVSYPAYTWSRYTGYSGFICIRIYFIYTVNLDI